MREGKGGKKMEKIRKKELGKGKKGRGRNRGDIILNIN